jgi:hypothetical protein
MSGTTYNPHIGKLMKRLCDVPVRTHQQRLALSTYASLVTEFARTAHTLQTNGEARQAQALLRYASEVTDMACEYVRKSGEIAS